MDSVRDAFWKRRRPQAPAAADVAVVLLARLAVRKHGAAVLSGH